MVLCFQLQRELTHSKPHVVSDYPYTNRKQSSRTPKLMWTQAALLPVASGACALETKLAIFPSKIIINTYAIDRLRKKLCGDKKCQHDP